MLAFALGLGLAFFAARIGGFATAFGGVAIVVMFAVSLGSGVPTLATWLNFGLAILAYNFGLVASVAVVAATWRESE